ncbi:hypothetical protein [Streptomyces sp. NPDC017524]|uniref:hypothetical protein n=1 Tax=unclassified Streptomyces TaxID=2593676 RepID=UPI0037B39A55
MADPQLPDWTNEKFGTMVRAALWLVTVVGEGGVFTREDLKAAFPGVSQIDRRVRDLRDHGWLIATNRDEAILGAHETRFVRAGDPVWRPGFRRPPRKQERAGGLPSVARGARMGGGELLRLRQVQDPDTVLDRLKDLSPKERSLILAWIAMGHRPSSPAELAWRAYRSLPDDQRHDVAAKLGELVSAELYEELPTQNGGDER